MSTVSQVCQENRPCDTFGGRIYIGVNDFDFFQSEGRVRYDEIVRDDLPITERFNEAAYKRYVKLAKISEVLDKESILRNLNCISPVGGGLCFTNVGALFFKSILHHLGCYFIWPFTSLGITPIIIIELLALYFKRLL